MNPVNIIKQKMPQGALQGLDSLSAIFQQFFVGDSHLQNQQQEQVQDQNVLYGLAGKVSKGGWLQSSIYTDLLENLVLSLHQELKNKADEQATRDSDEGVRFRVFLSLQNYTSGMWLLLYNAHKAYKLAPDEFITSCCRRNIVGNPFILKDKQVNAEMRQQTALGI